MNKLRACLIVAFFLGLCVMPTALEARTLQYDDGRVQGSVTLGFGGSWKEFAVLFDMPYYGRATSASVMYQSQISKDFSVQFYSAVPNPASSTPALVPGTPLSDPFGFTSSITDTPVWVVLDVDVELLHGPFFLVFRYPHQFVYESNLYNALGYWTDYATEYKKYLYRWETDPSWRYSYSKYMFRVEITEPPWSPVIIQPLARTQLASVLSLWEDLLERLPEEPTDEMAALIEQIQGYMANAVQLTNPIYASGQISKAAAAMQQLAALLA